MIASKQNHQQKLKANSNNQSVTNQWLFHLNFGTLCFYFLVNTAAISE